MTRLHVSFLASGLLGLAFATSAVAQQSQEDFPRQTTSQKSCQEVNWNADMLERHPRLIDACQEVVDVDGEAWARFHAKFKRVERDGKVTFSVQDRRDRPVEEIQITPTQGQVAYIDGRETPFRQLSSDQMISLYVPEGEYGFATQAGAPRTQLARATPVERTQQSDRRSVLPATASSLPWFALAGFLSLLGGLILTIRRLG